MRLERRTSKDSSSRRIMRPQVPKRPIFRSRTWDNFPNTKQPFSLTEMQLSPALFSNWFVQCWRVIVSTQLLILYQFESSLSKEKFPTVINRDVFLNRTCCLNKRIRMCVCFVALHLQVNGIYISVSIYLAVSNQKQNFFFAVLYCIANFEGAELQFSYEVTGTSHQNKTINLNFIDWNLFG